MSDVFETVCSFEGRVLYVLFALSPSFFFISVHVDLVKFIQKYCVCIHMVMHFMITYLYIAVSQLLRMTNLMMKIMLSLQKTLEYSYKGYMNTRHTIMCFCVSLVVK